MSDDGVGCARLRLVTCGEDQVAEVVGLGCLDEIGEVEFPLVGQGPERRLGGGVRRERDRPDIAEGDLGEGAERVTVLGFGPAVANRAEAERRAADIAAP